MSDNGLVIRPAEERDAETVARFNAAMALETENRELGWETALAGVKNLLKNPQNGFYLIAELEGESAGSLMITGEWSDWRNGIFWWIQSVYIRPEYRRRGIYRRLYAHVKELARARADVCGLRLYVEQENLAAQRTYLALGMREAHYRMFEQDLER